MTTEEKARAYDEALEIARKSWFDNQEPGYKHYREFLESMFRELRESEDEKIVNWLIRLINTGGYRELESDPMPCLRGKMVAYLEKLKEIQFGVPGLYYYNGEKVHYYGSPATEENLGKQNVDFSTNDTSKNDARKRRQIIALLSASKGKCMASFAKDIDECVAYLIEKQKEQTPWKVGANAYFTPEQKPEEVDESTKRLNDNWMKQHFDDYKEQKPVENEKVEITDFEQSVYDLCPVLGIEEAKATASDLLELAKKTLLKTGKVVLASNYPEGCSFEDGFHLGYNEGFNATQKEQKPNYCHHEVDETGWTEEYRKAYYDGWNNCNQQHSQLKAEQNTTWSEEDGRMIDTIVSVLSQYMDYKAVSDTGSGSAFATPRYSKEIDWLNSLRPPFKDREMKLKILKYLSTRCSSLEFEEVEDYLNNLRPSWKPSGEQMMALRRAVNKLSNSDVADSVRLSIMHDNLKKLM